MDNHKKIVLNETGVIDDVVGFKAKYFNEKELMISVKAEAMYLDEGYVLIGSRKIHGLPSGMTRFQSYEAPFGLVCKHEENIVETTAKRLHDFVKKGAEEIARNFAVIDLQDNTKYAPEKLSRGGK